MRIRPRVPAAAVAVLLAGAACTGEPAEPPGEPESPRPLPTVFGGDPPPGVAGEPSRFLHGPGSDGPDILDDSMGVRIEAVGDAFLISSNSEERHVLQDAADGGTLWEGGQRVDRFGTARDGSDVLILTGDDGGSTVIDDDGETVWSGGGRDAYVGGVVVRRPEGWTAGDPYGDFTVLGTDGREIWDFAFTRPEAGPDGDGDDAPDPDPDRLGVPVGVHGDTLLMTGPTGLLQARDIGDDTGDLLWSMSGDDPSLAGETGVPLPRPQVVGYYGLPGADAGDGTAATPEESPGDPAASARPGTDAPEARDTVLLRWSLPEDPSLLSLHDLGDGETLWTLAEPGANPVDREFTPAQVTGTVYDPETGTLLLPQASGDATVIAVDLATGEERWEFEDADERSITPSLALAGYVYGDSRSADDTDSSQVVLEAETKDVVADESDSYVETVTDDGHVLVVRDRQRFVFPPAGGPAPEGSASPTG
ncbi:PQQ-binding-like beta-propeller repeat protein [Nocardiopsis mangrovi]|uniref:PQQ-binding-like beta-propeller repeat protein n=1 Tax=Nocardiopsis mangrovi TaxID=1179818 RepID=A0ABV9E4U6_9ACTN